MSSDPDGASGKVTEGNNDDDVATNASSGQQAAVKVTASASQPLAAPEAARAEATQPHTASTDSASYSTDRLTESASETRTKTAEIELREMTSLERDEASLYASQQMPRETRSRRATHRPKRCNSGLPPSSSSRSFSPLSNPYTAAEDTEFLVDYLWPGLKFDIEKFCDCRTPGDKQFCLHAMAGCCRGGAIDGKSSRKAELCTSIQCGRCKNSKSHCDALEVYNNTGCYFCQSIVGPKAIFDDAKHTSNHFPSVNFDLYNFQYGWCFLRQLMYKEFLGRKRGQNWIMWPALRIYGTLASKISDGKAKAEVEDDAVNHPVGNPHITLMYIPHSNNVLHTHTKRSLSRRRRIRFGWERLLKV